MYCARLWAVEAVTLFYDPPYPEDARADPLTPLTFSLQAFSAQPQRHRPGLRGLAACVDCKPACPLCFPMQFQVHASNVLNAPQGHRMPR